MKPIILDLCAGTGAWSQPYVDSGQYHVLRVDLPTDARLVQFPNFRVHGVLMAPPCTVFSYARNRYPPTDTELLAALSVVDACIRLAVVCRPQWWALENPRNKLRRYLGPPVMTFRQWEYSDAADKPTCLWGAFTPPIKHPGPRTKASTYRTPRPNASPFDAITPPGFARAFFEANP